MEKLEVTEHVGSGGQHNVGRLADGRLLKWPNGKARIWDHATYKSVSRDLWLLHRYEIPIPNSEALENPRIDTGQALISPNYGILTEWVEGEVLKEQDLIDNEDLRMEMQRILGVSMDIRRDCGAAIDFLGAEMVRELWFYFRTQLPPGQLGAYNFRVTADRKPVLIDTSLLDPSRAPWFTAPAVHPIVNSIIDTQQAALARLTESPDLMVRAEKEVLYPRVALLTNWILDVTRPIEEERRRALTEK